MVMKFVNRTGIPARVPGALLLGLLLWVHGIVVAREAHYDATNLWTADVGSYNQSSPALDRNGIIYVTTWDGRLLAINPDGSPRWSFQFDFEAVSTPAIGDDGTIYFGSRNRHFYAVNAAGKKLWEFKTGGWVDASPALGTNGFVYFGSWDKTFYALNSSGQLEWKFPTQGPIVSSAAIDGAGTIYFGSHDGNLYALNPDGTKRWEFKTRGAITSSPAIGSDHEIYFTSTDGQFYCIAADGTLKWKLQTGGITASSPVLGADGTIYVSVNQTHCAISAEGKFLWRRAFWHPETNYFGEAAASVLTDNTVVFTGGDGYVMTVPVANGADDFIWKFWLAGASYSAPLVATNGTVYVMALPRLLHALENDAPLVRSSWPTFRGNSQRNGRVSAN